MGVSAGSPEGDSPSPPHRSTGRSAPSCLLSCTRGGWSGRGETLQLFAGSGTNSSNGWGVLPLASQRTQVTLATGGGYPHPGPSHPYPLLLLPQVPVYLVVLLLVLLPIVKLLELPSFGSLKSRGKGLNAVQVMPWINPTMSKGQQQGPGERSLPSTALVPVPWARARRESKLHLHGVLTQGGSGHLGGSALASQKQ